MKTTFTYDDYYTYATLEEHLQFFASTYPQVCQLESLLVTPKGRHVYAVTLSIGDPAAKPAYYIDGNTHAGEVTGSMAAMHTIDYLLTNMDSDPKIHALLERVTIYVIPRLSPDGAERYLTSAYSLRSVDRPYLSKTQQPGLYEEDMDQNGIIAMMRVPSPYGAWKKDPHNEAVMIKRAPDDLEGEFYQVYAEGCVEGEVTNPLKVAPALWGLDFNRNYPFGWYTENRQPGAGPYPLSNPENKAVVDFVLSHPNIGGVATHHTNGGIILYPPGTQSSSKASKKDMRFFREIGAMGTEEMGYGCINIFDSFFTDQEAYSSGAFDDWCYQSQGIPAYTIELWDLEVRSGCGCPWPVPKEPKTTAQKAEDYARILAGCQENAPEAILPWRHFDHPQLGDVEIGGFDFKMTYQNPPRSFLCQEVEKATRFTLRMAATVPCLKITNLKQYQVGEDVWKIELSLANTSYLPTYVSDMLMELKLPHAIEVKLETEAEIVMGEKCQTIERLEGYGCIPTDYSYGAKIRTNNYEPIEKTISWVVKAPSGTSVSIAIDSPKAGHLKTGCTL